MNGPPKTAQNNLLSQSNAAVTAIKRRSFTMDEWILTMIGSTLLSLDADERGSLSKKSVEREDRSPTLEKE